jgi:cell wall-associated NlpC family hydrolase
MPKPLLDENTSGADMHRVLVGPGLLEHEVPLPPGSEADLPLTSADAGVADVAQTEPQAAAIGGNLAEDDSWLEFDPEISTLLHRAVHHGMEPDQFEAEVRSSGAFAEVTDRRARLADPVSGEAYRAELQSQIAALAGTPPDDPAVTDYVGRLAAGTATMAGITSLVAPMAVGLSSQRVEQLAAEHGVPMTRQTAEQWTSLDEPTANAQLEGISRGLYPWLAQGMTYNQHAGVLRDVYTQELGAEPDPDDTRFGELMAQSLGQPGLFRSQLRRLPAWQQTPRAQALYALKADQVTRALIDGEHADAEPGADPYSELRAALGQDSTAKPGETATLSGESTIPRTMDQYGSSTVFADAGGGGNLKAISLARRYLGIPYRWGGSDPRTGLDCSGYTQLVYRQLGVNLPRTSFAQARVGQAVRSLADARPGDLVFWDHGSGRGHIGIYAGNGWFYNAPHTGDVVRLSRISRRPTTIRRVM